MQTEIQSKVLGSGGDDLTGKLNILAKNLHFVYSLKFCGRLSWKGNWLINLACEYSF